MRSEALEKPSATDRRCAWRRPATVPIEVTAKAMFEHILIPVDFSEKNGAAIDVALDLATQFGSRLTLLHVIERIEHLGDDELRSFYDMLEQKAIDNLEKMAERVTEHGIRVDRVIEYGKRAYEIIRYSQKNDVQLVLLSSRKVDLNHPAAANLGTLSHQISIFCQCPVLMVK